jgi:hypothetical protein
MRWQITLSGTRRNLTDSVAKTVSDITQNITRATPLCSREQSVQNPAKNARIWGYFSL